MVDIKESSGSRTTQATSYLDQGGFHFDFDTVAQPSGVNFTRIAGQLRDYKGQPESVEFDFAVFSDSTKLTLSGNATYADAQEGTIIGGTGTNSIRVLPDPTTGRIDIRLDNGTDETVHAACSPAEGTTFIHCGTVAVTYS